MVGVIREAAEIRVMAVVVGVGVKVMAWADVTIHPQATLKIMLSTSY